jgi:hypothetical protein
LTHLTAYLARKRGREQEGNYRTPWFPVIPVVGGLSCAGLGVFQAIVVPDAGAVLVMWLALGVLLYFALFKGRAEAADASAEALDPRLTQLRGRSPLVLLPIANPKTARSMVEVANALAPSEFARGCCSRSCVRRGAGTGDPLAQLADAQDAVRRADGLVPPGTRPRPDHRRVRAVAGDPTDRQRARCESLLLGLPKTADDLVERQLEGLISEVDCDVASCAPDDGGSAPRRACSCRSAAAAGPQSRAPARHAVPRPAARDRVRDRVAGGRDRRRGRQRRRRSAARLG